MTKLLRIAMQRLASALILLTSLGCKADSSNDPGMVYGFDNVSLGLSRTTHCNALKLSD